MWRPEVSRLETMVQVAHALTAYDGKIDSETKDRIITYLKNLKLPGYEKDDIQSIVQARIEENKDGITTYERGREIVKSLENPNPSISKMP